MASRSSFERAKCSGTFSRKEHRSNIKSARATERSVVFRINVPDFYYVLASHHELAQGLIKNMAKKAMENIRGKG